MRFRPPIDAQLDDPVAERVRRSVHEKIGELQSLPTASAVIVQDVSLPDGVEVAVPHRLGRKPLHVNPSPPRGPSSTGRIEEVRTGSYDRTQVVVLKATGWGATVAVDVEVK